MTCQIVIPVQPPDEGKSRLAPALDLPARAALIQRMFQHVLATALRSIPDGRVSVVSRSAALLELAKACGAVAIPEKGRGLNPALEHAASLGEPDLPLLVLSADLPFLEPADIAAMLEARHRAGVVLGTDRAGRGTNALYLSRPKLIGYAFGEDSFFRHRELAKQANQRFRSIQRPGLATDIDEPADLQIEGIAQVIA